MLNFYIIVLTNFDKRESRMFFSSSLEEKIARSQRRLSEIEQESESLSCDLEKMTQLIGLSKEDLSKAATNTTWMLPEEKEAFEASHAAWSKKNDSLKETATKSLASVQSHWISVR
jgi:hypothetical protein